MDTLGKMFGFKGTLWVAILVFFTVNLSYNVLVVNGGVTMELMGNLKIPLGYSNINHGYFEEETSFYVDLVII